MKDEGMNIAALVAALGGDLENALVALTPGGIEAQEADGQRDFVASEILPIKCNFCKRKQLEQMGIVFGESVDDLFVEVQLPDGWEKVPTDHSMWSKLVDEKGRERASIFYKAAFYGRDAHISLTRRFACWVDPIRGYDEPDSEWHCVVTDCDKIIWTSGEHVEPEPKNICDSGERRRAWLNWDDQRRDLGQLGLDWLNEHYSDWENPLAYWD